MSLESGVAMPDSLLALACPQGTLVGFEAMRSVQLVFGAEEYLNGETYRRHPLEELDAV